MGERKRFAAELRRWVVPSPKNDAARRAELLDQAALALIDRNAALVAARLDAYTGRQSLPTSAELEQAPPSVSLPTASMMAAFFIAVPFVLAIVGGGVAVIAAQPLNVVIASAAGLGAIGWLGVLLFSRRERRRETGSIKAWIAWYQSLPRALKAESEMVVAKPKAR